MKHYQSNIAIILLKLCIHEALLSCTSSRCGKLESAVLIGVRFLEILSVTKLQLL